MDLFVAANLADRVYRGSTYSVGSVIEIGNIEYKVIAKASNDRTGFNAMAVSDQSGGVAIVFAGTDSKEDLFEDFGVAVGASIAQEKDARYFYDAATTAAIQRGHDLKADGAMCSVTVIGHSLGGYLAQKISQATGTPAVAINAPGQLGIIADIMSSFGSPMQKPGGRWTAPIEWSEFNVIA